MFGATGAFAYPGGRGDINYGELDKTVRQPSIPIRVPEGIGVITIQMDDPLKTSYSVLYQEAKKRGIPITLVIPSMISSFDANGAVDPDSQLIRATDAQIAEMICKGGACPVFHSTSHKDWEADDSAWFKNEVLHNANYGDHKGIRTPYPGRWWPDQVADTPGDLVAAQIQSDGFFLTDGTGATHVDHEGFVPPGQWGEDNEIPSLSVTSQYWDIMREKWGKAFLLPGGKWNSSIPFGNGLSRIACESAAGGYSASGFEAMVEGIVDGQQICHLYWHETLASGETGGVDEGSANAGKTAYTNFVNYTNLTGLLDRIKLHVDAGRLMVLGFGAASYIERGEPINLMPSMRSEDFSNAYLPQGWGSIRHEGTLANYMGHSHATYGSKAGPYFFIHRKGEAESRDIGFWFANENHAGCQSYILSGYAKVISGTVKPKVVIYGGLPEGYLTVNGTRVAYGSEIATNTDTVGGLLAQPLYEYEMDGTDNVDIAVGAGWKYFQIPFTIPKPLARFAALLTTSYTAGVDGYVYFGQLRLIPNGV